MVSPPFSEEEGNEAGIIQEDSRPALWSTEDFTRRVRACESSLRLDMLHILMMRRVPVGQRADYIALLNQRDEEISFLDSGTVYWDAE